MPEPTILGVVMDDGSSYVRGMHITPFQALPNVHGKTFEIERIEEAGEEGGFTMYAVVDTGGLTRIRLNGRSVAEVVYE